MKMLAEYIKEIRRKTFVSQEEFAQELSVAVSTINRWETGKVRPNISAMKKIKHYCEQNNISFSEIEIEWRNHLSEDRKND